MSSSPSSLQLARREEQLAFFSPAKKTHLNRAAKILPHVISWSRLPEREYHSQALDKIFSKHELGQQFKAALLIETNSAYSNSEENPFCKRYVINKRNLIDILKKIVNPQSAAQPAISSPVFADQDDEVQHWSVRYYRTLYADELSGKKAFQYADKRYRKWHPLQNVRRSHKGQVFAGYLDHDYDISTALISIMLGDAQKLDSRFEHERFHLVFEYRDKKAEIRELVGKLLDIDADAVKELFSYINNNGVISTSPYVGLFGILGGNKDKVGIVRTHKFFRQYRAQIKSLWRRWLSSNNLANWKGENRPYIDRTRRFDLYFYNERKILDAIEEHLKSKGLVYFLEHDGFRTNRPVDQAELEQVIKANVQIEIRIENKTASA